jgi:hypothetical protein
MALSVFDNLTELSLAHLSKQFSPISNTYSGDVNTVSSLQLEKALAPIFSKTVGRSIFQTRFCKNGIRKNF